MTSPIHCFRGPYRWLSNFWLCLIPYKGSVFPSVENAYVAAKMGQDAPLKLMTCTPGAAKRMGKGYVLPELERLRVMTALLNSKFAQGRREADLLVSTQGRELVEVNTWGDTFWGVCGGVGENRLGKALMSIREELRKAQLTNSVLDFASQRKGQK